jgi:hypothetical protein
MANKILLLTSRTFKLLNLVFLIKLIGLTVWTEPRDRSDALEAFTNGVSGTKSKPVFVPISKNLSSRIAPHRGCEFREAGRVGVRGVRLRFMDANVEAVAYED